jgi:secondary thiamine-phosphate synthase enzyme
MHEITVRTTQHAQFINLDREVQAIIDEEGISEGTCVVFVPHTTAGVTINENADPDVIHDMLYALDNAVPWNDPTYQHSEGNTAAHVKASMMGNSATALILKGRLAYGTWQSLYFCEFDGPRTRKVWVHLTAES